MASSASNAETIETPLLKVPYESLKRTTRDRKGVLEEYAEVMKRLESQKDEPRHGDLELLQTQLRGIKRKLKEIDDMEAADLRRCQVRLQHLVAQGAPQRDGLLPWNRRRLDRLMADHLLRRGHLATAALLAKDTGIQDLVDTHIFEEAQQVARALDRHDCRPALEWCSQNSTKLKKTRSRVIFKLRLQEFVELVRAGNAKTAIQYARKHLATWAEPCEEEHQRAFAALIFTPSTSCPQYQELFSEARWQELKDLFLAELYRLHSLTPASLLNIHLQAGLSALKVPQSLEEGTNKEDPLHLPDFRLLAADLPFSKHVHSKLVCAITRQRMDEHNPPLVTPKGYCYSEAGMQQIADANGGIFVDPVTGDRHEMSEMKKAYIS